MGITKKDVANVIRNSGKIFGTILLQAYGDSLNQIGERAFSDAIEIGIDNTLSSLYEAKVNDQVILRVVSNNWGISTAEIENRLIIVKKQAAIRALRQHLRLQGWSPSEISYFMREHSISATIMHDKNLWKLKDNPPKLLEALTHIK